jgi:glycosyltransferase involved in cell wall biosynthesis
VPVCNEGAAVPDDAQALADAVAGLAASRAMRERLRRGGLAAVRARTWEASLGRLAAGWHRVLAADAAPADERVGAAA